MEPSEASSKESRMISNDILAAQTAIELPSREVMAWSINIAVPIIIQNNINLQVCGVGYGNTAICNSGQWNVGGVNIQF
jgi:hypothetical protein